MSDYTMFLKDVIGLPNFTIGLDKYPIFKEDYRPGLNAKIVDHYLMREIGQETPDLFRFYLNRKMNEIMPLYNKLYESERLEFDPLSTVDLRTIHSSDHTSDTTSTANSSGTSDNANTARTAFSETPQTMLAGNKDYASNATDAMSEGTATNTGTESQTGASRGHANDESTTTGRQVSGNQMLAEYRANLLNIDMLVIAELEPMFMQIWNPSDNVTSWPVPGVVPGLWYGRRNYYV